MAFETPLRGEKGLGPASASLLGASNATTALCGAHRQRVAVLFARHDSNYKQMSECDVYDADRDARTYDGPWPVVAHPPCRAWGSLRHFAKPRADERNLARLAVALVREFGGVLEHPAASTLWAAQKLPKPGQCDAYGGFTLVVDQDWFGHRAEKRTRLYIVGCEPRDVPPIPLRLEEPTHVVSPWRGLRAGMPGYRPQLRKDEREHTPPAWLNGWSKLPSDQSGRGHE